MATKLTRKPSAWCCQPKPALKKRSLIGADQAGELAAQFKVLANETRLRLIHALARSGELTVTQLSESVGMKPQAVSNQLQRLVDRRILASRRNGSNVHYQIIDPCVLDLLDRGLCLVEDAKERER